MNESSFGSDIFDGDEPAANAVSPIQEADDIHNIQEISLRTKASKAPDSSELAEVSFGAGPKPTPVVTTKPEPEPEPAPKQQTGRDVEAEAEVEVSAEIEAEAEVAVEIPSTAPAQEERPESSGRRRGRRGRGDRGERGDRRGPDEGGEPRAAGDRTDQPKDEAERSEPSERSERREPSDRSERRESSDRSERRGSSDRSERRGSSDRSDRSRRRRRGARSGDETTATARTGSTSEARTPTVSGAAPVGQRIAMLLNLHELSSQAKELDGELAVSRLLRRVGRNRATIRAVAYITPEERRLADSLRDSGLEVVEVEAGAAAAVQIAVDAMAISGRVDCVVLAPAQEALAPLATVLRSQGLRVETASFGEDTDTGVVAQQHVTLGEDSLFRP